MEVMIILPAYLDHAAQRYVTLLAFHHKVDRQVQLRGDVAKF
jgi:hypothetical protein